MGVLAGLRLTIAIFCSLAWLPVAMRLRRTSPELLAAWLGMFGFGAGSMT